MRNCKSVIENFFTICPYLHVWSWLDSLYYNCHMHHDRRFAGTCTVGIISGLLILLISPSDSNGDIPTGGLQQRIGNYDVSIRTDPLEPHSGETVKILVAIAAVDGDDISGIPVDITVKDDGSVLSGLDRPIAVPYGHYTYQYKYEKPGMYSLVVDVYDIYFTGRQVSFVFPIEVKSTFFGLRDASNLMGYILVPSIVIIASTILVLSIRKRHKTKLKSIPHDNKR
jgi:hypothetical protein